PRRCSSGPMASRAGWTRATSRTMTGPRVAAPATTRRTIQCSSARPDRVTDEPPAPPTRRQGRHRAARRRRPELAAEPRGPALGHGPPRRAAARDEERRDEPDVDRHGRPVLARPRRADVRHPRGWLRAEVLELSVPPWLPIGRIQPTLRNPSVLVRTIGR